MSVPLASPTAASVTGPQSRPLAIAVVVLGSLLVAAALITLAYSVLAARRHRRREPLRAALRSELLDRLYGRDEPAWDAWVASLSAAERDELESVLDVYLRELAGRDAATLAGLGRALGIPDRARREIVDGGYWERTHALVWLALLRDAPDRDLLRAHCTATPRERAAAARVLYAAGTDDRATTGVDLLLRDDPEAFSVFGVDTLYRVAESDPGPFFDRAAADFETWPPALQRQALLVVRHLTTVVGGADLSWVVTALASPDPSVRAAAWRALGAYGWNRRLRDAVDLGAIPEEPAPTVRADAYRALGVWGDAAALDAIEAAGTIDPDPRAQVAAAETLVAQRGADAAPPASEQPFGVAWDWAAEHARFDRLARDISRDRERLHDEVRG
ncbi:HEAT repeat domain-containing protein [Halorubrum salinarum]|uniref:HEAT repeat domain-containing protein n=1 Tax=Halorubrum salinarum TaxID=2739057 RepID=A0A7D3XYJ2_9EURY|nr:HEAT repeat domain-containing protein [Halorubrum salinarum]QKG91332.1 HEAT repeat domain-containing protein [Halorubrum salinarum]